jgi:hypothetical protein
LIRCAVVFAALAFTTRALGDDFARRVDVVIAAERADAAAMEDSARELLKRLDVDVRIARVDHVELHDVVTPVDEPSPAFAHVWVDIASPDRAALYLAEGHWDRIFIRLVPKSGSDAIVREELAHILESVVEALLAGAHVGMVRAEAQSELGVPVVRARARAPPPPHVHVETPVRSPIRYDVEVGYEVAGYSPEVAVTHGPFAGFFVGFASDHAHVRWGAELTVQYRAPVEVTSGPAELRLDVVAPRLLAVADAKLSSSVALRAALGFGFDVTRVEGTSSDPGVVARAPYEMGIPEIRALVAVRIRVGIPMAILAGVAVDVDPTATQYALAASATQQSVLAPWPARPSIVIGVTTPDF